MKTGKLILFGFIGWLVPFLVSCFMYTKEGHPLVDIHFFKTIMLLIGNTLGVYLMVLYFKKINKNILKYGIYLGIIWVVIFWALDFAILIPISGMSIGKYFMEIGLRYLLVPAISIAIAYSIMLDRKKEYDEKPGR